MFPISSYPNAMLTESTYELESFDEVDELFSSHATRIIREHKWKKMWYIMTRLEKPYCKCNFLTPILRFILRNSQIWKTNLMALNLSMHLFSLFSFQLAYLEIIKPQKLTKFKKVTCNDNFRCYGCMSSFFSFAID
jgi:hypothetical protein